MADNEKSTQVPTPDMPHGVFTSADQLGVGTCVNSTIGIDMSMAWACCCIACGRFDPHTVAQRNMIGIHIHGLV